MLCGMRKIAAVIFDFDGVLVQSEHLHFEAFARAAGDVGIELTASEYFENLIGYDDRGVWRAIASARGITLKPGQLLELLAHKARVARQLILDRKYEALAGVEETVRSLWRRYPLAICSGALRDEIEMMLEGVKLRDCFRVITSAEDVSVGKPDPAGYLHTIAELSRLTQKPIEPESTVVFEDAPRVIERLKPLGFRTVGVASTQSVESLAIADAVVTDMRWTTVRAVLGR